MITDEKGLEYMRKLNTHKCKTCGKVFVNFKGLNEHVIKFKHYEYELVGSGLNLMFASVSQTHRKQNDE